MAIREASQKLNNFDLSGCILVSTGEPSLLSLAACLWANIDKIYYGCSNDDIQKSVFVMKSWMILSTICHIFLKTI